MFVYMAQPASWPVQRFRATLDRILDETGLPQAGLAALVPMDQSQLSRWKSGSSRPKFESLVVLGEALRAKYPSLDIGPNELLESAGYAPPEPVGRISQVHLAAPDPPGPGVRVEQYDDRHLYVGLTIDTGITMDEAIAKLEQLSTGGKLTDNERATVAMLRGMGFAPEEVAGAVLVVRGIADVRATQQELGRRKA